jgi:magnesium chelatase accessory protein
MHPNHSSSRFVEAAGLRWHVQQSGQGPALLLVHGAASSNHTWRDLLPILARRYTVLAVDLPGHGLSGLVPVSHSSIVGVSNLLAGLLAEIHFNPAIVVGHSAGAVILCNMALSHQINPRVIVSVNGASRCRGH